MSLPIFHTQDRTFSLMQTKWSADLAPLLSNPFLKGILLTNQSLISGVNVLNHLLGRVQQGFVITDIDGAASLYRSAPFNNLTLTLTSTATVTVSLYVF